MCFGVSSFFRRFLAALALPGLCACTMLAASCGGHGSPTAATQIPTFDASISCTLDVVYQRVEVSDRNAKVLSDMPWVTYKNLDDGNDRDFFPMKLVVSSPDYLNKYEIPVKLHPGYWKIGASDPARYIEAQGDTSVLVGKTMIVNGNLLTKIGSGALTETYAGMAVNNDCSVDPNPARY